MENQIPKSEIKTWKIKVDNFFFGKCTLDIKREKERETRSKSENKPYLKTE